MVARMTQQEDGQWVVEDEGAILFGPGPSHKAVGMEFREHPNYGWNIPLVSTYTGTD